MIKKGDIIRCNHRGIYYITTEQTLCVALTDEETYGNIIVMVVEDNRPNATSNKAIGRVYSVDPRYFDVIDYKDNNATQKDRTLKTAKKLCKRIIAINHIDRYVSNKQMTAETEYPPTMCNMFMRWGYTTDDGKKFNMLEFELSPIDSDSKRIERLYQYEVDCDEISAKSHSGEIRTLGRLKQMIVNDGNPMSVTKLFDRKEEETESIDDLIDKDFLDLLDSLILF